VFTQTPAWQAGGMTQPTEPSPEDRSGEYAAGGAGEQPAVTPQWPSQSAAESGFAPPGPPAYGPFPKTSNNAIVALVLSIVAWVVCPIIPAIIALVFANKADKEIVVSNGWVTGAGLVTASKIVAWINIGLYAALIGIGVLVLVVAAVGGALA
jgi:hypothetical protein